MLKEKTLRWRIIAVLLTVSLLPLILLGVGSWIVFGDLLEEKAHELLGTIVQSHAHAIETYLDERVHLLQFLANSRTPWEIDDLKQLRTYLDNLNRSSDNSFIDLGVIDANGNHLAYVGPYDLMNRNYKDADWFKSVMAGDTYISDVFLGFRRVPHCIIAVKMGSGSQSQVLRITINSNQFDALVKTGVLGKTGDAYIVNREGLYQTTPKVGSVLDKADLPAIEFHREVKDRLIKQDGIDIIQVTSWVNKNRWMLVVQQEAAAVQAPVNQAITKVTMIVLISVFLLIATTILATRHLTNRIDKAREQREEMSRAFMRSAKLASIGELATGLAHEINNPLAIISAEQTNIDDLVREMDENINDRQMIFESVERCKRQVQRCASITKKMLQFGRKRETTMERTDIAPRLKSIIEMLQRQANVRNVQFIMEIDENIPQVYVDPVELEQVIVNLINNALDALPNGGHLRITTKQENNQVFLTLEDNGTGIAQEDLDHIFEPFFTTKPVGKGTGLGLSVCMGIVHSWGGRLEAESTLGKGTKMIIGLPIAESKRGKI